MVIIVSAFEELSYKKNATQSPLYPGTSYDASNAVDRNVGTCMRTEGIGLKSVYHSAWWNVDLGGIYNIYSVNILFKNYEGYECREGLYGERCSQLCSGNCKDNETCNHVTGQCDKGCTTGWKGAMCDEECVDGTFGYDCNGNCSANCLNELPCNKTTGHCDDGCNPGYTDSDCKTQCDQSYGENCRYACGEHCVNQTCDRFNGSCLLGRTDGQSFHKYSEKIRLLTEELIESSKQMLLWIIGFSVALAVCVLFVIITCTITILRKKACHAKRKTEDKQPCLRSTPTAKHPVTTNIVSNYQELNTEKERNAYESILLQ
uniref:Multiple epidermal growth factor-like domains 10 n=1 Tax=Magallana gigas TaxID=29159 RepID=A0A8W8NKF0_MAGGI